MSKGPGATGSKKLSDRARQPSARTARAIPLLKTIAACTSSFLRAHERCPRQPTSQWPILLVGCGRASLVVRARLWCGSQMVPLQVLPMALEDVFFNTTLFRSCRLPLQRLPSLPFSHQLAVPWVHFSSSESGVPPRAPRRFPHHASHFCSRLHELCASDLACYQVPSGGPHGRSKPEASPVVGVR